jgi:hypothetical protein
VTARTRSRTFRPLTPWLYGVLGLIPFVAGALGAVVFKTDDWRRQASLGVLLSYGALILSFLGGARWGLEIGRADVRARVISLSMLPTLAGFFLLSDPAPLKPIWRFTGLAIAFVAQWVWDISSWDAPVWYPRLRSLLTVGAVLALLVGALRA